MTAAEQLRRARLGLYGMTDAQADEDIAHEPMKPECFERFRLEAAQLYFERHALAMLERGVAITKPVDECGE